MMRYLIYGKVEVNEKLICRNSMKTMKWAVRNVNQQVRKSVAYLICAQRSVSFIVL
jgi:hypothetical protein